MFWVCFFFYYYYFMYKVQTESLGLGKKSSGKGHFDRSWTTHYIMTLGV